MSKIAKAAPQLLDVERARDLLEHSRDIGQILEIRDAAKLAAEYHRVRGASVGAVNDALEIALRAQRRFGVFLIEEGPKPGRPKKDTGEEHITLASLGVSKNEAGRCRKLASTPDEVFEDHIASVRAKGEKLTMAGTIAATSEAKDYDGDSWGTPPEYIALEREVLGEIDLDPASNEHAQTVVLATTYYTAETNGLEQDWSGRVHLNPPYSHPLVERFVLKLIESFEAGSVSAAICLVNNATDAEWCQQLLIRSTAVCFVKGRIAFHDRDGKPVRGTRQGQLFAYLGPDPDKFEITFGDVGAVLRP